MIGAAPVAVVGLGCVYPGAPDVEAFWANIVAGVDSITDAPPDRIDPRFFSDDQRGVGRLGTTRGGFVEGDGLEFDPSSFGIMPVTVADAEPDQMLALKTAAAALSDADDLNGVSRERIGVVLGRGSYLTAGLARLDQRVRMPAQLLETLTHLLPDIDEERLLAIEEAFDGHFGEFRPESAIGLVPNLAASRIANRFDLGGPAYTVDAACASSLVAVDAAVSELTSGRCDAVLAGGVHHCHDVTLWSVFSQLGALSASGEIRPFSRQADGVLVSEGTGILALERLADAIRRNHRVYAIVRGTGAASDGRHASLMSPGVEGQVMALERAYGSASIDPSTIGLLEGHGTATPTGDKAELETIRCVFGGRDRADGAMPVLGSVKSNIGHAMPAAGAAGLIKAVLAVYHGVLPPTLHGSDPNPALSQTGFRLIAEAEPWAELSDPRRAGVNAFGFGGINAHVIVEQHGSATSPRPTPARAMTARDSPNRHASMAEDHEFRFDAIVLQGRDTADLASQFANLSLDQKASLSGGPARIAVVEPTRKRMELAAKVLQKGRPWRGRNDIWFEPMGLASAGGRLAFLFPGIEPNLHKDLGDIASWFGLEITQIPDEARSLEKHARQTFATGRLLDRTLRTLGVVPDDVVGHSFGEWTGLFSAELIPADQGDAFLEGLEPGSLELPGVVFLALGCGYRVASEVIAGLDGVVLSHDNCPHQSIVCGPEASIDEARRRFAERKVLAQELPFRSGFHTPFLKPYLDIVHHHWERMPLQAPRTPLWSATTCERYPDDPAAIRQLALDHLIKPVRFRELLETLYGGGVRIFVQMGVGSLVAFVDDTLKDRPLLSISAASPSRPGLDQLSRAAVALWVEGVDVQLEKLLAPHRSSGTPLGNEASHGQNLQLALGTPIIQLPESVRLGPLEHPALSEGAPIVDAPASPALHAEFEALLAETRSASRSVAAALASGSRDCRPAGVEAPPVQSDARTVEASKQRTLEETSSPSESADQVSEDSLDVGIEHFPWLLDHCFYRQPEGWPDVSDRFPVVPMTTLAEILSQAALGLAPDMTVTRVENLRAFRWLAGAPRTRVAVTARRVGKCQVEAAIEGYAKAVVHLQPEASPNPPPAAVPLINQRPAPARPDTLYADHWMFHGPSFQGVRSIKALGDNGIDGAIESLTTPGAWLDNAGQLYGLWIMATVDSNFIALPQSVDCIEFFGLQPPPGESVDTSVRIADLGPRTVRADIELVWHGSVVVRITGWVDRRFDCDRALWLMLRYPEDRLLASPLSTGYVAVEERWRDSASRELMARRYLDSSERATYERLNPNEQRLWLLGRIAAKDAIRHELWSEGHGPIFPIEVPLIDEDERSVLVRDGPARGRRVAVAHAPWIGVAATGSEAIHVECVDGLDRQAARSKAHDRVAAAAPPTSIVQIDGLSSPVHLVAESRSEDHHIGAAGTETFNSVGPSSQRKEYVVARTRPA